MTESATSKGDGPMRKTISLDQLPRQIENLPRTNWKGYIVLYFLRVVFVDVA